MVVCFANGVYFEALAEALNREGHWSDVVGYQKVDFSHGFAVVFKNTETRDRLVENGINVNFSLLGRPSAGLTAWTIWFLLSSDVICL